VTTRNPFQEIEQLLDRLGEEVEDAVPGGARRPVVDLLERPDEFVLEAEVPGVAEGDVEVRVAGRTLHLHVGAPERPEGEYRRRERRRDAVDRRVELPAAVEDEDVAATLEHGVLTVTLPKQVADEETREIPIE
jgi:HSP20 family protein